MLKDKPIRQKLVLVILMTSGFVLLLTNATYWLYQYYTFRKNAVERLSSTAKIIAANSTAALAFADAQDASEVLGSLDVESEIICGVLYDSLGNEFARHCNDRAAEIPPREDSVVRFGQDNIYAFTPVVNRGTRLGTLYIASDTSAVYKTLRLYSFVTLVLILISLVIAFVLSRVFQRRISDPLLNLAATATQISQNADYSVRVEKQENDEVGTLTDAFNDMLIRIEKQDDEIRSLNQGLEEKVRERTRELEIAYNEMEAFSYIVSHDLNAPLRRIETLLSVLTDNNGHTLDESTKKSLASVGRNAGKMRALIGDLLTFSQLGKQELKRDSVPMRKVVSEVSEEVSRNMPDQKIDCSIGDLPTVLADETTITQVWENLINNAAKYSRNAAISKIEIGCIAHPREYTFYVKDNGAGFDMKFYEKLFKPFERLHNSNQFEGTGVGLAIVHRIITKHGGRVWAESAPGEGATFFFSLPRESQNNA